MLAVTLGRKGGAMRLVLAAALLASLVPARDARAATACTAAAISGADGGCPAGSGPCNITKDFTIPDGCTLDFGTRVVTLKAGKELTFGSGTVLIKAGSLT